MLYSSFPLAIFLTDDSLKPGMLQCMGSQRIRHNLITEQEQSVYMSVQVSRCVLPSSSPVASISPFSFEHVFNNTTKRRPFLSVKEKNCKLHVTC